MLIKDIDEMKMNLNDGDIAYLVFDTDADISKSNIIREAIKLAKENNIRVITSTPCIELWFLLHYEYTTASMTNSDVVKNLKKYYPKYDKKINIYNDISENMNKAIINAKRLEKYQLCNGKEMGEVEANPSTEMYKIVEKLLEK